MLFAILDYAQYRRGKGIYSDANIQREGGRLAVPENFPRLASLPVGSIFFFHTRYSVASWLVMYYTSSVWSHTALYSEQGQLIDQTTSGLIEHPASDYLDGKSFIEIYAPKNGLMTPEEAQRSLNRLRSKIGLSPYGWLGVIRIFFAIILGTDARYRIRFSADFFIMALLLATLSLWNQMVGILIGSMSAIYVLTVIANTPRRRAMREAERKWPKTKEVNMIEALWTVEFLSSEGNIGAGVAIFETKRVFGGDASYYYLGNYDIKDDQLIATIKVKHHSGEPSSIFGELKQFTVQFSGEIRVPVMTISGYLVEDPARKIVVRLTKRADLP